MKKFLVVFSLFLIGAFIWFYQKNDPVKVTDRIEYEYKKKKAQSQTLNKIAKVEAKKPSKRLPSSVPKAVPYQDRTFQFKDYSRLPAKANGPHKKGKKPARQRQQHLQTIQNEYFSNKEGLSTPAGDVYVSDKLQAIGKTKYEESMGAFYREVNQHVLFQPEQETPASLQQFDPQGPSLVTYNKNSGKVGILTGKIILEFKGEQEMSELGSIIDEYQLNVLYEAREIKTFFLGLKETQNLDRLVKNLRQKESVKRADLEVIENLNRPL